MQIYRKGTDSFGAVQLVPQVFYQFWDGDIDATDVGRYPKPLDPLPEINWEILVSASEWRERIVSADTDNSISMSKLREIPDNYIEAAMLNLIYGYPMTYNTMNANYLPLRVDIDFNVNPICYPAYAMVLLAIKTLIQDLVAKGTVEAQSRAETLRQLLRHLTYVAIQIVLNNTPVKPNGTVLVGALSSTENSGCDMVYYDNEAYNKWIAAGGNEGLACAEWILNQRSPDDQTITGQIAILNRWKPLTDITQS